MADQAAPLPASCILLRQNCFATEVTTRHLKSVAITPPESSAAQSDGLLIREPVNTGREEERWMETKDEKEHRQDIKELFFFKNFIVNNSTKTKSCIYKTMAVLILPSLVSLLT